MRRVGDLGVELDTEPPRAIAHRRSGQPVRARGRVEPGGQCLHRVAVAHPRALGIGEPIEDARVVLHRERGRPELPLALRDDLAPRQHVGHEVHPVANAEDREPPVEDRRIDQRRARLVHARRPAREDHADDPARRELLRGHVVREDLAVHARLAHAPRDELHVLAAVVEDRDRLAGHRRRGPLIGPGANVRSHQYCVAPVNVNAASRSAGTRYELTWRPNCSPGTRSASSDPTPSVPPSAS